MGGARFIQYFIVAQILSVALIIGLGYLFRFEIAHWVLEQGIVEDREQPREEVLLQSTEERTIEAIEHANPAVVAVVATKEVPIYERYYEEYSPFGGFFGGFEVPRIREKGTEEREIGGGSGFIVSADGHIVTNRHVVSDEDASYAVLTNDGESHEVEVVARDPVLDIAIVRSPGLGDRYAFTPLQFGDSQNIKIGQTAIAIGNALGEFRNSVSVGVVSGLSRSIVAGSQLGGMVEQLDEVIQTDAAINLGNSGGPLLDLHGEVIGVNVAASLGAENIGFALPAHVVEPVVNSVIEVGEIIRPFLGVRYTMVTERMVEMNDLPVEYGALVVAGEQPEELAVVPGSPADRAGLEANDIILAIDGVELKDGKTLASVIRQKRPGEVVTLRVFHDGEEREVSVTLEKAPAN